MVGMSKVQTAVRTRNSSQCLRADGPSFSAEGFLNRYRNSWSAAYHAHKAMIEELSRRRGRPAAGAAPTVPVSELALPVPLSRFQWPLVRTNLAVELLGTWCTPSGVPVGATSWIALASNTASARRCFT